MTPTLREAVEKRCNEVADSDTCVAAHSLARQILAILAASPDAPEPEKTRAENRAFTAALMEGIEPDAPEPVTPPPITADTVKNAWRELRQTPALDEKLNSTAPWVRAHRAFERAMDAFVSQSEPLSILADPLYKLAVDQRNDALEERDAAWRDIERLKRALPPPASRRDETPKTCQHGHTKRTVGCVSCVMLFHDQPCL